jgi:NADPH:quinone reductase-like Zn-dependent oxidoreductase
VRSFAEQLANAFGAEVTGLCSTTRRILSARSAHTTSSTTPGTTVLSATTSSSDTAGRRSLSHLRCALAPRGTLVIVGGDEGGRWLGGFDRQILRAPLLSLFVSQTLRPLTSKETREDLVVLKEHTEAGKVTPAIDTTYPLHEVPEAIHYLGCNRWQSVGGGCWTTCIAGWP